jgi:hypothetical protein
MNTIKEGLLKQKLTELLNEDLTNELAIKEVKKMSIDKINYIIKNKKLNLDLISLISYGKNTPDSFWIYKSSSLLNAYLKALEDYDTEISIPTILININLENILFLFKETQNKELKEYLINDIEYDFTNIIQKDHTCVRHGFLASFIEKSLNELSKHYNLIYNSSSFNLKDSK